MNRDDMADLTVFVAVAEERSFTRAATRLGLSQSALSQIMRRLEDRLGVRLLARTTRSVGPTEAGELLLQRLGPMLHDIDRGIAELGEFRDRPAGNIRIVATEHAASVYIGPRLAPMLLGNPDVRVEVIIDYGLTDIVAERFDAGVRLGVQVDKDMIAVRISPDIAMSIVGSPAYLLRHGTPRKPSELVDHRAINLRLPTSGTLYGWRLIEDGAPVTVNVEGQTVFNALQLMIDAACLGLGLACVPADTVAAQVASGALVEVLPGQVAPLPGYHLYYPHRRHSSPAFRLLVDALRHRGGT